MDIAQEMLTTFKDDPDLLKKFITGDESWVYDYDIEIKLQSSQLKRPEEPRLKKALQVRSNVKLLLTLFFDCNGVVHQELLIQGRTVNREDYLNVMYRLSEAIHQKRTELWKNGPSMALNKNPHQTVTRFSCVDFSIYVMCGFSVPQIRQFYFTLHTHHDQNELHLKRWFFWIFWNIAMIFKVMSQYFLALFNRIHNHIRWAEG